MQIMTDEGSLLRKIGAAELRDLFFFHLLLCVHHAKVLFINQKPRRLLYLVKHVNRKIIKSGDAA